MIPAQWVYHFSVMCNWVSQRYLKNAVKHLFEIWTVPNLSSAHDTLSWSLFLIFLLLKKKKKNLFNLGGSITSNECTSVLCHMSKSGVCRIIPGIPSLPHSPPHSALTQSLSSHSTSQTFTCILQAWEQSIPTNRKSGKNSRRSARMKKQQDPGQA